ncbi:MAG: hypothetical protein EA377_04255 [Phycisphaerales bacterium]|nr:MAG: hypothetical protein EA377_04255 [Phycisphaerales bacterium]
MLVIFSLAVALSTSATEADGLESLEDGCCFCYEDLEPDHRITMTFKIQYFDAEIIHCIQEPPYDECECTSIEIDGEEAECKCQYSMKPDGTLQLDEALSPSQCPAGDVFLFNCSAEEEEEEEVWALDPDYEYMDTFSLMISSGCLPGPANPFTCNECDMAGCPEGAPPGCMGMVACYGKSTLAQCASLEGPCEGESKFNVSCGGAKFTTTEKKFSWGPCCTCDEIPGCIDFAEYELVINANLPKNSACSGEEEVLPVPIVENPDPAEGGSGSPGSGGSPCGSSGGSPVTHSNPVDLFHGHKIERAVDLSVTTSWGTSRMSRHYVSNPDYSAPGTLDGKWIHGTDMYLHWDTSDPSTGTYSGRLVRADGYAVEINANNCFDPCEIPLPGSTDQTLRKATVEHSNLRNVPVWRLVHPGQGGVDFFRANEGAVELLDTEWYQIDGIAIGGPLKELPEGKVYREFDLYGNAAEYKYVGFGPSMSGELMPRLRAIYYRPGGNAAIESILFNTWYTSGPLAGKLHRTRVFRVTPSGSAMRTKEALYTYRRDVSHHSNDLGPNGSLVQVVSRRRLNAAEEDAEETAEWHEAYRHYRYYDESTPGGGIGQIKLTIEPDQIEEFAVLGGYESVADAAEDLLGMDDEQVMHGVEPIDLAAKFIAYESGPQGRVESQIVQSGCNCGGSAYGGHRYLYDYNDALAEPDNTARSTTLTVQAYDDVAEAWETFRTEYYHLERRGDPPLAGDDDRRVPYLRTHALVDPDQNAWATHYVYDSTGHLIREISPEAVSAYTPGVAGSLQMSNTSGLVHAYVYNSDSRLVERRVGEGYSDQGGHNISQYNLVESIEYRTDAHSHLVERIKRYPSDDTANYEATEYEYGFQSSSSNDDRIAWRKTSIGSENYGYAQAAGQYWRAEIYDPKGNAIWSRDENHALTYREFDTSGRVMMTVRNADAANLPAQHGHPDLFSLPGSATDWSGRSGSGGSLTTRLKRDLLGRIVATKQPSGRYTYTRRGNVDLDPELAIYRAELTLPHQVSESENEFDGSARVVWRSAEGRVVAQSGFEVDEMTVSGAAGMPSGVVESYQLGDEVARTRNEFDLHGTILATSEWHDVGGKWHNLDQDRYETTEYEYDSQGRIERQVSPNGTVQIFEYDFLDRVVTKSIATVDDTTGQLTCAVTQASYYYDSDQAGTQGVGNGQLRFIRQYVSASEYRETEFRYDYRGRRLWTIHELPPHEYVAYDNLDRVVARASYTTGPSGTGVDLPDAQDRSRYAMTMYSGRGMPWRTAMAIDPTEVDPEAGAGVLVEQRWYDGRGQVVGQIAPGQPIQKTTYDGLGRPVKMFSIADSYQLYSNIYDEDNFVADVSSDVVVEEREYSYEDETGLLEIVTQRMRTHDTPESVTGALSSVAEPRHVITKYTGTRYDAAGRTIEQINFGTNHHTGDEFRYGGVVPDLGQVDPSESLVTMTRYDKIGRIDAVIDPEGIETGYRYDDMGRRIAIIENQVGLVEIGWLDQDGGTIGFLDPNGEKRWTVTGGLSSDHMDRNRVTSYVYDGVSNVIKQVAHLPDGTGESVQVTEYVYGVQSDCSGESESELNSNDLLHKIVYPEGEASTSLATRTVTMDYNRLGEVIRMQDQNGTIHLYKYDERGRPTIDYVAEFGSHIDDTTNYQGTQYNARGMIDRVTTAEVIGGIQPPFLMQTQTAVRFIYDELGELLYLDQSHSGQFPPSGAPTYRMTWTHVRAPFDPDATGAHNYSRVGTVSYPFDAEETDKMIYAYGESGSVDDLLSRVSAIGAGGSRHAVEYRYLGLNTHVAVDYPSPDVQLDRTSRANGERTLFDRDDTAGYYPAFDRFGRVVQHRWVDGAFMPYDPVESLHDSHSMPHVPPVYELSHTYDRASNRLTRSNTTASLSWDHREEIFEYDGLHRLKRAYAGYWDRFDEFQESGVASKPSLGWELDSLGNWSQVDQLAWDPPAIPYSDPETCQHELRTFSDANELVSRGVTYTGDCEANGASGGVLNPPTNQQTYDAAGNMITNQMIENPFSSTSVDDPVEYRYVWDAWNRLVRIEKNDGNEGWDEVSSYRYNALNWRISRITWTPDLTAPGASFTQQTRLMYYNPSWQLVLERIDDDVDGSFEPDRQIAYYWGNRYIDDIVLRRQHDFPEDPDPGDPVAPEPVVTDWYHITDTLFSTVAVLSETGALLERVSYDAYGRAQRHRAGDLTGNGIADFGDLTIVNQGNDANNGQGRYGPGDITRTGVVNDDDVAIVQASQGWGLYSQPGMLSTHGPAGGTDNILGYAGYIFNAEIGGAGLYTVRHRHYAPDLGRWISRDPIGYVDGMNLYEYVKSQPVRFTDSSGLCSEERSGECECNARDQAIVPYQLTPDNIDSIDRLISSGKALSRIALWGRAGATVTKTFSTSACLWDAAGGVISQRAAAGIRRGVDPTRPVIGIEALIDSIYGAMSNQAVIIWTKVERRCCVCESVGKWRRSGTVAWVIPTFSWTECIECDWEAETKWVPCNVSRVANPKLIDQTVHLSGLSSDLLIGCEEAALESCHSKCP